jgi:hypothetical protein
LKLQDEARDYLRTMDGLIFTLHCATVQAGAPVSVEELHRRATLEEITELTPVLLQLCGVGTAQKKTAPVADQ